MKYIVEIDSKILEDAKAGYVRLGEIADAVKTTATPYNPTGDAISRSDLRKTICGMDFDFGDYYDHTDKIIDLICEKIDNAQAVQQNWRFYYDHGYAQAKRDFGRPQGERTERALAIVDRLSDNSSISLRERGTLRRAILLPERPQGEWKVRPHTDTDGYCDGYDVYCSECGKILFHLLNRSFSAEEAKEHVKEDFTNFCSECGADMKGEEDVSST